MKNNMHYILDLKVSMLFATYAVVSFSNIEIMMKIIVFLLTVGYTIRRWYLLEKNKKE
jgi:hypothetical protein